MSVEVEGRELAVAAARAAEDKGATEIQVFEVGEIVGITGWFVLASASNPRQVRAVVDRVEELVAEAFDLRPMAVEGGDERRWVLMDYGEVVVHVFHVDEREFYRLERLYADAPRVEWRDPAAE